MSDSDLSQAEADALLAMEKKRTDETTWLFPGQGESLLIPLVSVTGHEEFQLDVERGRIKLVRRKYQTRTRKVYVLARLDYEGPPHRNPELMEGASVPAGLVEYAGAELGATHLHVYVEGWGDRWAVPPDMPSFADPRDPATLWGAFMSYCNVTEPPDIQGGLFW